MIQIDILPDDVLLEIFDFHTNVDPRVHKTEIEAWQSLIHVCRRWRSLVFGSPRRLNLQLVCTLETPARDTLDVWPALPLCIWGNVASTSGMDEVIVALGQSNCVCQVIFKGLADRQLKGVLGAMQVPFPELLELRLTSNDKTPPIAPNSFLGASFLGGSAPRLQHFELDGVPFPGLPKLLLSATHLVYLSLYNIRHSGYISPEAMASLLSLLPSLKEFVLHFQSLQSRPDWESRRPLPSKCSVVPALIYFMFEGVIEYLEDLVTFIDAPQLRYLLIGFLNQIDFDGPRLAQFISRTPILGESDAHVELHNNNTGTTVRHSSLVRDSMIKISCREPDRQLLSVTQVCNTCLPPLSMIEDLYIEYAYPHYLQFVWKNDAIEDTLWSELLLPFPAVKNLYLSKCLAPSIAAALQEIVGMEVLPSLQNIFVEGCEPLGPFRENIGQFVVARELSGHPITISVWDRRR